MPRAQTYEPYEAVIEHSMDEDSGKLFVMMLKTAGFRKKEDEWVPVIPDAVVRMFAQTKAGFNPLLKIRCFPARVLSNHAHAKKGQIHNPCICPARQLYSQAEEELGSAALGSDRKMKPVWLLRKLIADKWISTLSTDPGAENKTKPDWRISGVASVMTTKKFAIKVHTITNYVDGIAVATRTGIVMLFTWQARYRKKPGDTHPRIVFPSLV